MKHLKYLLTGLFILGLLFGFVFLGTVFLEEILKLTSVLLFLIASYVLGAVAWSGEDFDKQE